MRILLIEDDQMLARSIVRALHDADMSVDWVRDGVLGDDAIQSDEHALVLLDLGLPELDGSQVLRAARKRGIVTPIVVITARDDVDARVSALDSGADDYLIKPFESRELLARIRAVARRHVGLARSVIETGPLSLDLSNRQVRYREATAFLSPREFALLQALAEHPGKVFSRSHLEEKLYSWGEEVESNAIEVLIHYVRKRFDKDIIRNIRGAGWMVPREE